MRFVLLGKFGADAFNSSGGNRAGGSSRRSGGEFWKRALMRKSDNGLGKSLNGLSSSSSSSPARGGAPGQTIKTMASRFSSSSFSSSSSPSSSSFSGGGLKLPPMMKSALTSAGLGIVGDGVAQTLQKRGEKPPLEGSENYYDYYRTARQSLFNLTFYGPLQHVWYIFLGKRWPTVPGSMAASNLKPFATKVFLNQAALGPVVVACFFAWSQALTNTFTVASWTEKVQRDALPTLQKGWAFWVPASAINFAVVPVNRQVLYMSCCSIVWNCILSQAGNSKKKDAEDEKKKKKKK